MVGRPREFDTDQVLDAAMRAFWTKGYEATSLADLMQATGLHKGSLYQAFGDKHALFIESLKRYLDDMRRQKTALLTSAPTPLEGIRAVAHAMIEMADDDASCPKGCMAINALVELAPHDCEVQQLMGDHIERMRGSLQEAIECAQADGQLSSNLPADVLTALLMTFMAGLGTSLKGTLNKVEAHRLVDVQLDAFL